MNDRELLEAAAKAAGIKLHVWGTPGKENFADMDSGQYGGLWQPLHNDGDAFRLAVKLNLHTAISEAHRFIDDEDDIYAATRRAVVRAAAEIGAKQ